MKFSRIVTVFLVLIIVICVVLIFSGKNLNNDNTDSVPADTQVTAENASQEGGEPNTAVPDSAVKGSATDSSGVNAVKVTVTGLKADEGRWLDSLGVVKANDQIKVFSSAAGQLQSVYVEEGGAVKAGDPLFLVGGLNGTKAVAQIQFEIAQKNYLAAQKGLEITKKGNAAALSAAHLQLESARHAAEGYDLDMQVFDRNIGAAQNGLYYLQDSYNATVNKNGLDLEKTQNGIDALKDGINRLEEQKIQLEAVGGQEEAIAAMDKNLEELYSQLDTAKIGYETLEQAKILTENQLLGQIAQTETTGKVLYLNQLSLQNKLGFSDGITDAVKLAQSGLEAAKIKNDASLLQAQTQADLAKSNLELAQAAVDGLTVRAPVSGAVGEILARPGDLVSQQSMLTQVSGQQDFELRAAVDADSAAEISPGALAEVEINGRSFRLPVKNIGTSADAATRLVNVTVALPRVKFRANQTLHMRLPLAAGSTDGGLQNIMYVPLDAVIIGTEEQYVFIAENGKAVKKNIRTGDVHGDMVQVLEGLSENDKVIIDGARSLISGQNIDMQ
jgi:HlyD family secretion protein